MAPTLLLSQLLLVALVLLCLLIHVGWPANPSAPSTPSLQPDKPQRQRATAPTPCTGLIHTPRCEACKQGAETPPKGPGAPPPVRTFRRGRQRTVDTAQPCCPEHACASHGGLGPGTIRANGHPGGQPWRQLQCGSCPGYVSATHGTLLHGTRASVERIVRVIACLAEGLGIRGTARVFASDPHTVLGW